MNFNINIVPQGAITTLELCFHGVPRVQIALHLKELRKRWNLPQLTMEAVMEYHSIDSLVQSGGDSIHLQLTSEETTLLQEKLQEVIANFNAQ